MKLVSPATAKHRFKVEAYKDGKYVNCVASSASGRHEFEIKFDCDTVKYIVGDTFWVWDGENWLQGEAAEKALKPKPAPKPVVKKKEPKPTYKKEWTPKDRLDKVEEEFKKVTDKL